MFSELNRKERRVTSKSNEAGDLGGLRRIFNGTLPYAGVSIFALRTGETRDFGQYRKHP